MLRVASATLTVVVALALASVSMMQAWGSSSWRNAPILATTMWPANGEARGNVAEGLLKSQLVANQGILADAVDYEAIKLAKAALSADPRNVDALLVLAYRKIGEGDVEAAREIFDHIAGLTKRHRETNIWLAQYHLEKGEMETALGYFDLLLRSGEDTRDQILPVMIQALRRDDIVPAFEALLADDPPWALRFWQLASANDGAHRNVGRIRRSVAASTSSISARSDEQLVSQLVAQGEIDEARRLVAYLSSVTAAASDAGDYDFRRPAVYAPIGWRLASQGDLTATLYPTDGVLLVSTLPGAFGIAASRLTRLQVGRYEFGLELEASSPDGLATIAQLRCADARRPFARVPVRAGRQSASELVSVDCEDVWVELQVASSIDAIPGEIVFERVILQSQPK